MNNAPITLILIAAIGLIAVLSLGIFFAVKPRTTTRVDVYYDEDRRNSSFLTTKSPTFLPNIDVVDKPNTTPFPERRFHHIPATTTTTSTTTTTTAPKEWIAEKRMSYGKVVGVSYDNGFLYAPSHDTGNISVLSTPNLRLVEEIQCPNCRIYDIGVLRDGSLVVGQGRRKKLSKIGRREGKIVKELHLDYATKGIAVSPYSNLIYLIDRSHDKVHKYTSELEPKGTIYLPNEDRDDCNFLAVGPAETLYISCENNVYIMNGADGEFISSISPRNGGSYSVGIGVGSGPTKNMVMVVERGKEAIDVFSIDGDFQRTVGSGAPTLWSDVAVSGGYIYVVDYIGATIKARRYLD